MNNILIISTGGTFNKEYNKISGNLDIDTTSKALNSITKHWLTKLNYINIINKDSLDFNIQDRKKLLKSIKDSKYSKIVVIHGTDTIDISAKFIDSAKLNKTIVFTGAMVPFSINPIEATANLAFALGYCKLAPSGVYIAINSVAQKFDRVIKNRELGKFELLKTTKIN